MRVGILASKKEARKMAEKIKRYLEESGHQVFSSYLARVADTLDLVITFGGDGLVLSAASKFNAPILRVNWGTVGWLCNVRPDLPAVKRALDLFFRGRYRVWERLRLKAQVFNNGCLVHEVDAGNEVVIGGIPRTVYLELKVKQPNEDHHFVAKGDGIMIATRMGSTGYFEAAGGPVLTTEEQVGLLANNAKGGLSRDGCAPGPKSLVFHYDTVFEASNVGPRSCNRPYITADGRLDYRLKKNDRVIIGASAKKTLFVELIEEV